MTGKQIPYDKFIDMYVVQVHPVRAIMEMDYFIKMIEMAETKRDEEINRAEAGIEDEENLPFQENSFDLNSFVEILFNFFLVFEFYLFFIS